MARVVACCYLVYSILTIYFGLLYWYGRLPITGAATLEYMGKDGTYHQVTNISSTLVGNKIVDHSDVAGTAPTGAPPTTSSYST